MKFSNHCKFVDGAPFYLLISLSLVSNELILFIVTIMCLFSSDHFVYIKYIYKIMTFSTLR